MSTSETRGSLGRFPTTRLRRNRQYEWLRDMVAETRVSPHDLIWPLFVHDKAEREPIVAMPGVDRLPIEEVVKAAADALREKHKELDQARHKLHKDLKDASDEERKEQIAAFKESQKEHHAELKEAKKALREAIRDNVEEDDRRSDD